MKNDFYIGAGVSASAVSDFFRDMLSVGSDIHTLQIYENGRMAVRVSASPYLCTDKREIYSLSKSFASTAIGLAYTEGLLSPDDRVVDIFPDKLPDTVSENLAEMRVRHLLSMNTGHERCVFPDIEGADDAVKTFLSLEVPHKPGTRFCYNTGASCMLSEIIRKVTGISLFDYINKKLFKPLDIHDVRWMTVKDGANEGGCGIQVSSDDIIKLGLLYINKGVYNGIRLLSEDWVSEAIKPQSDNSGNGTPDWSSGYGYQFWINAREGFRGDGAMGQLCMVFPERGIVVAVQAELGNMQEEIDILMKLIYDLHNSDDKSYTASIPAYMPLVGGESDLKYDGVIYTADENPANISQFSLSVLEDELIFRFSNGFGEQTIRAGNGYYLDNYWYGVELKPRLGMLGRYDVHEPMYGSASYKITENGVLIVIRMRNCPHTLALEFRLEEIKAEIDVKTLRFTGLIPADRCRISGKAI